VWQGGWRTWWKPLLSHGSGHLRRGVLPAERRRRFPVPSFQLPLHHLHVVRRVRVGLLLWPRCRRIRRELVLCPLPVTPGGHLKGDAEHPRTGPALRVPAAVGRSVLLKLKEGEPPGRPPVPLVRAPIRAGGTATSLDARGLLGRHDPRKRLCRSCLGDQSLPLRIECAGVPRRY